MIETDLMTTYTSPRTGTTYEVVAKLNHRVVDFVDGQPVWAEQPTFNILLEGKPVQFALSEEGIAGSVAHFEGYTDGWTSSPRD